MTDRSDIPLRTRFRVLRMGLSTVLGVARRGFFIPYRYAGQTPAGVGRYDDLEGVFRAAEPAFAEHLKLIASYGGDLDAIGDAPPPEPRWEQSWFPRLDAAAAYAMIRTHAPARLTEVGSGHSTRFYARASRDAGSSLAITAIDPAPRADISSLGVEIVRRTVQEAGPDAFTRLRPGDILSIDSSHILMPGTDVDMLLNRVLPSLPSGVLVHIHDIFLPDDYPSQWAWRGYNEQQGVGPLLQGGYDLLWASHYVATRMADAVMATVVGRLPLPAEAIESSVWLRKR